MKGKQFAEFLTNLEGILRAGRSQELADALNAFGRVFSSAPRTDVGDICSVLSDVQAPKHCNGPRTSEMFSLFPVLRQLLNKAKADKTVVEDIDRLAETLRVHDQTSPDELANAAIVKLREQSVSEKAPATSGPSSKPPDNLVKYYVARLAGALGDDAKFKDTLDELKADARVKRAEALALAKEFAMETAKSREHALKLILRRHTAVLGSRARQKANKGRTAA
jgi:hypothetical protein